MSKPIPETLRYQFNTDFCNRAMRLPEKEPEHRLVHSWSGIELPERLIPGAYMRICGIVSDIAYYDPDTRKLPSEQREAIIKQELCKSGFSDYVTAVYSLGRAIRDLKKRTITWSEYDEESYGRVDEREAYIVGGMSQFMGPAGGHRQSFVQISQDPEENNGLFYPLEWMRNINISPHSRVRGTKREA